MQRVSFSSTGESARAGAATRTVAAAWAGLTSLALICGLVLTAGCLSCAGTAGQDHPALPEFPTRDPQLWINSSPLSISDLKGQVVLIDVWTYG